MSLIILCFNSKKIINNSAQKIEKKLNLIYYLIF